MICPIAGCKVDAPPRGTMCPVHWALVPERLRLRVGVEFDPRKPPEEQAAAYHCAALDALDAARRADEVVRAVPRLKALTLWRPWAWLIAAGHKPVENRDWPAPASMIGQRVAIHAGQTIDKEAAAAVRQEFRIEYLPEAWATGVVAIATLDRVIEPTSKGEPLLESPWYSGRYGWVWRNVVPFPAVECKGAQGLWDLPAEVARTAWYRRAVGLAKKETSR